jgi:hypothetical protein
MGELVSLMKSGRGERAKFGRKEEKRSEVEVKGWKQREGK